MVKKFIYLALVFNTSGLLLLLAGFMGAYVSPEGRWRCPYYILFIALSIFVLLKEVKMLAKAKDPSA